jgi:hypothetical protein
MVRLSGFGLPIFAWSSPHLRWASSAIIAGLLQLQVTARRHSDPNIIAVSKGFTPIGVYDGRLSGQEIPSPPTGTGADLLRASALGMCWFKIWPVLGVCWIYNAHQSCPEPLTPFPSLHSSSFSSLLMFLPSFRSILRLLIQLFYSIKACLLYLIN